MLNEDNIIKDFPLLKNFTYLDSASTSLTPLPVINSINDYFINYNSNISRGAYKIAIKANENVDESRENISKFLNTKTEEIIHETDGAAPVSRAQTLLNSLDVSAHLGQLVNDLLLLRCQLLLPLL